MLSRLERALRNAVDQVFGRAFGGSVQPTEVIRRLTVEMASSERETGGRTAVANRYRVRLAPGEVQALGSAVAVMAEECAAALRDHARRSGWETAGPFGVEFLATPGLATGQVEAEASSVAGCVEMHLAVETGPDAGLGRTVAAPRIVIGRVDDASFALTDTDVSRHHASLDCEGYRLFLRDLGSTNGTFVDGQRVRDLEVELPLRFEVGRSLVTASRSRAVWDEARGPR